jgi:hypothetical protein
MNLQVPYNAGKLSGGYTTGGPSNSAQLHGVKKFESVIDTLSYDVRFQNWSSIIVLNVFAVCSN